LNYCYLLASFFLFPYFTVIYLIVCKVQSNSCVTDSCYNVVYSSSSCGSSCEAISYSGAYICKSKSTLNFFFFFVCHKFFYRYFDDCYYNYTYSSSCPSSCRIFDYYVLIIIIIYNTFYYLGYIYLFKTR
jgi:hypothetical protein